MPSFRRRESVIDADRVAQPPQDDPEQRSADSDEALALAEEAEAEAAEAEAIAAAARARAKAIRLRRQAAEAKTTEEASAPVEDADAKADEALEETPHETEDATEDATEAAPEAAPGEPADDASEDAAVATAEAPGRSRRLRMPRIRWKFVAAALAVLLILAFAAASGFMVWHHRQAVAEQERTAEFAAAARQSVVTLMSLDFNKAQEDVKRIIDNSTGQFKADFEAQAEDFAKVAKESKVVTEVTVNVAAVKSMTDNNATALVSATSRVTNTAGANQEPRSWRLMVDLVREGDQIKMSKVEFVP
ncbi:MULTISPECIES: hypothetical protein [unclassified Mycobacterium]|uniref:hypothetical protein n=1 Tax=unclassified Mycobacterium TaxID=2642494 RepID=UPI00073FD370|nr:MULTISPECIES: hypothetical protein [unclassified Mycobacterium]KUH80359.1 hypothetical protein AU185_11900 [Mycobacterium sp. GA-0227b]KUH81914.1 hypothetical protein AU186_11475 [Mycobacterium sp. GA-1999]KUH94080.1 hypothetical protein AU187_21355 [Mycobacterium sp. IS-1556]